MPFDGLREFLTYLEVNGELTRISKYIESNSYEVSVILERLPKIQGKAVIFEDLDFDIPMCANVLGTFKRIAMALETTEEKLFTEVQKRKQSNWLAPKWVSDKPFNVCIVKKDKVNLFKYPILRWNPYDAAPYITLGALVSEDPETGQSNVGIYRLMRQGKNQLGINITDNRHAYIHYKKAEAMGKPLEVAVAIGLDPAMILAAATDLEFDEDEYAFAGALRKEAVKITNCETINVAVPASSEIIIEGVIPPKVRVLEGPFGESTGFYGKPQYNPILKVEAITHREKPIYQATYTGKRPKEEHFIDVINKQIQNKPIKNTFSVKASNFLSDINDRLRLELTARKIKLPLKDKEKVTQNWAKYGLKDEKY